MTWRVGLILCMLIVLVGAGCRHFSNNPEPTTIAAQGDYVGMGNLDGNAANISMGITGPDSVGHYAGAIGYRGVVTPFSTLTRDSTGDTLRFGYTRNNVQYNGRALITSSGLVIHFSAPTGIPDFRLNKELGGYNLTGIWNGAMYSSALEQVRAAVMQMDQEGSLFIGTLNVNLLQNAQVQFNSGSYSGNSFQVSGTVRLAGTDYPFQIVGSYVNRDSTSGTWQAGDNGSLDHGTFGFGRSFE